LKQTKNTSKSTRGGALFVAAGIFLSRVAGLVRERVFAYYFGNSLAADAFKAALKIPNFLQNLFGEGVLSASFIPVYARLLAKGDEKEADRVAGAVAGLLAVTTTLLSVLGVYATPFLIDTIAPGFEGEKRELTIRLVQIFFPGTALLVMSAWCLGILNSHRRFFLSYVAPVIWNLAIIGSLIFFGRSATQTELAIKVAWGLVFGSFLQFAVQLPTVFRLIGIVRLSLDTTSSHVRTVLRNFSTVVVARGVVQISAYIDNVLASLLPTGAVSIVAYAQTIYLLPVSLFGMSVSAANLPEMSRAHADHRGDGGMEQFQKLRDQLDRGLEQIAFFIVPSMAAMIFLGDVIVAALFQTGAFGHQDVLYVWATMAGFSCGLLASTLGRLYSSTFYALQDTKSPLRFALIRVTLSTSLGFIVAIKLFPLFGVEAIWGTAGITMMSAFAGWVEFILLRHRLNGRIGRTGLKARFVMKLWAAAISATLAGAGARVAVAASGMHPHPAVLALFVFTAFGAVYFSTAYIIGLPQARSLLRRFR
jgi:putative peptidoglycan lipid II flippase